VHEYGGASFRAEGGVLYYVEQSNQRWYRTEIADRPGPPTPLTQEVGDGLSTRYADGRLTRSGRWLVSVQEEVGGGSTRHQLVAVAVDGSMSEVPLVERGDFFSAPRPSPDGRWLAWVTWDHPFMPWDSSEVWLAALDESAGSIRLDRPRRVAGGEGTSVGQPLWCSDGSLVFVDDRSGWWVPYRLEDASPEGDDTPQPLVADGDAEFHAPDWILGQATIAELADGSLACRRRANGRDQLVRLAPEADRAPWSVEVVEQPCVSIQGVVAGESGHEGMNRVAVLGSTATEAQVVLNVPLDAERPAQRVCSTRGVEVERSAVSAAKPISVSTGTGVVPGLFFAPVDASRPMPAEARPPLVVFCHGGPTSAAEGGFDPVVQFFTAKGLAVALVNYRGSSGYGRDYRQALNGLWGEADVDDCVQYAEGLAALGLVDGDRMAIRGTSAGGLTALAAMVRSDRFVGAASWYGVTDLEALAVDTHDFESRYLDSLVGPLPEAAAIYRERSPIHHPEEISGSVLLLQGEDDPVVPLSQSLRFAERLRDVGVDCTQTIFAGESHGFRQAATIETCLIAELEFYQRLFGVEGLR
jgi:dipeptidyl aminopeptidase/acylaminoacyl peptidase